MKPPIRLTTAVRNLSNTRPVPIGAIDIGSNAIRLVLGEVDHHGDIRVLKKIREPVRLGKDVFSSGSISPKTMERAIAAFVKFAGLLKSHRTVAVRAVATSALREAKNREAFVSEVASASGMKIDIIDGIEEARLVYMAVSRRMDLNGQTALLIDIGGGSVEMTISINNSVRDTQTFPLGTVRLLQMLDERGLKEKHLKPLIQEHLRAVREFVETTSKGQPIDVCVGTGGNLECLGKLRVALLNRSSIFSMTYHELVQLNEHLGSMSIKERIQFLRLRPDRADVIIPAGLVVQQIMGFLGTELLQIPFVGLRDGILAEQAARRESKLDPMQ